MQFGGLYLNIWFIEKKNSVPFRFREILVDINILSYYKKKDSFGNILPKFRANWYNPRPITINCPKFSTIRFATEIMTIIFTIIDPSNTINLTIYRYPILWGLYHLVVGNSNYFHGLWHGYWLWTLRFLSRLVLSQFLTCDLWNVSKFLVIFSINDFMYAKKAEVSHEKIHWNKKMHALSVL